MLHYDFTGKKVIASGCKIAYPLRRGSHMWLQMMAVDTITEEPDGQVCIRGVSAERKTIFTRNIQNCVVIL